MASKVPLSDPPRLVGRDREQEQLRNLLTRACAGRGGLLLISGEAGIGKTTLVRDLVQQAQQHGALVLTGGCYDLTATPPYGPWSEAIRGYQPAEGQPPLPIWFGNPEELEKVGSQTALFEEALRFFTAVAEQQPLVIVLEDLHWSDPASLEALRYLGRNLGDAALLLLVTYCEDNLGRDHALYEALPLLVRESAAHRVHLNRLGHEAIRELVERRYTLAEPDAERLAAHVAERSGGNPFFAHEIVLGLQDQQVLEPVADGWVLRDLEQAQMPPLLRQVLDARLERLSPADRQALQIAAVIGQEAPLDLWQTVADLDEAELDQTIAAALEALLLEEAPGDAALRFRHALLREALYRSLLPSQRRARHRQVGELLAETAHADPDTVAHHFQQAGDARAFDWFVWAGERAARAQAWVTAADRYETAAGYLDDELRARECGRLLYRAGQLRRYADPPRSIANLERALQLAASCDDETLTAYVLTELGLLHCFTGEIRVGLTELDAGASAIDLLAREDDDIAIPNLPRDRSLVVLWLKIAGYYARAIAIGEDYIANARHRDSSGAYMGLSGAYAARGKPAEARHAYAQARQGLIAKGDFVNAGLNARAELSDVVVPYQTDQVAERHRLADEIKRLWTRGRGGLRWSPDIIYCEPWLLDGRWSEACELLLTNRDHIFVQWRQYNASLLGWLARHQGNTDLAWEQVRTVLPEGPDTEPGNCTFAYAQRLQHLAADLALDARDLDTARAWIEAHDHWLAWAGAVLGLAEGQLLWGRYHRLADDCEAARRHAERALDHASDPRQPLALIATHRLRGELATTDKRYAEAQEHLQQSLALAEACAVPFEEALTLLALADLGAASGAPDDAWQRIDQARAFLAPLKALPALQHATAITAKLSVRRGRSVHPSGLTPREAEVLGLVAQGLTDAEVAEKLFISPRTVGVHLSSVYNKLGVNSRVEATRFAVEQGLAGPS